MLAHLTPTHCSHRLMMPKCQLLLDDAAELESRIDATAQVEPNCISQCWLCFQPIRDAKTGFAACGHSFCHACLVEHVLTAPDTCPLCPQKLTIDRTEEAVLSLPSHPFHEQLVCSVSD